MQRTGVKRLEADTGGPHAGGDFEPAHSCLRGATHGVGGALELLAEFRQIKFPAGR